MDYIQVDIIGLSTSPASGGAYALVLGEVGGGRRLPIIIGAFEAQAIALELEGIHTPRPMTHDLLRNLFDAIESEVTDVVINELKEGTFFAQIRYTWNGTQAELDARPSDAVALAVRVGAPIYVAESVMDEAGILADEVEAEQVGQEGERASASPLERAQRALKKAIAEEDYEKAAMLRDEITRMKSEN